MTLGVWPGWNGTSLVCSDCGRAAAPIDLDVAVAIIVDLTYRFATRSDRFATRSDRSATSGGRSQCSCAVGECAARVAEMLTTLDLHLRQLSALDGSTCSTAAETTRSTTVRSTRGDVHASRGGLFEAAARLTWTIEGMTDACWHRPSTNRQRQRRRDDVGSPAPRTPSFRRHHWCGNTSATVDSRTVRTPTTH